MTCISSISLHIHGQKKRSKSVPVIARDFNLSVIYRL